MVVQQSGSNEDNNLLSRNYMLELNVQYMVKIEGTQIGTYLYFNLYYQTIQMMCLDLKRSEKQSDCFNTNPINGKCKICSLFKNISVWVIAIFLTTPTIYYYIIKRYRRKSQRILKTQIPI